PLEFFLPQPEQIHTLAIDSITVTKIPTLPVPHILGFLGFLAPITREILKENDCSIHRVGFRLVGPLQELPELILRLTCLYPVHPQLHLNHQTPSVFEYDCSINDKVREFDHALNTECILVVEQKVEHVHFVRGMAGSPVSQWDATRQDFELLG